MWNLRRATNGLTEPGPTYRAIYMTLLLPWTLSNSFGQVLFWNDQFNGGVVTGGFSLGIAQAGIGTFEMPIPAGSTIHWAYLFGTQVGTGAQDAHVQLNGTPYTFNASNIVGPVFWSPYGGNAMVHGIDVTNELDPTTDSYWLHVDYQDSAITDVYTEFYLYIAFSNPTLPPVSALIYFSDLDCQAIMAYELNSPYPITSSYGPVAFACVGGYSGESLDDVEDCELVSVNGTALGSWQGPDFNSATPFGTSGTFAYYGGVLQGLGDDLPDQAMADADVLSNVAAIVPNGSTDVEMVFTHCPQSPSPEDNHIWMMMLTFSADPCGAELDLGPDTTLCEGGYVLLDATMLNAVYTWQDGDTSATYTAMSDGVYHAHVVSGACVWNDTISVNFDAVPVFELGDDTSFCEGGSLLLSAISTPPGDILWWDGSDIGSRPITVPGDYSVSVTNGCCAASDSISISMVQSPEVDLGADQSICEGDSLVLAPDIGYGSVLWSDGSIGSSLVVIASTQVSIVVSENGCEAMDSVLISFLPSPNVDLGTDIVLCRGDSILLDVTVPNASYTWFDGTTAAYHALSEPTLAWVLVTADGCTTGDSMSISIAECEPEIHMPNVFSPNGDEQNPVFQPLEIKGVSDPVLTIWSRWGHAVHRSSTPSPSWDGRDRSGDPVPDGTYFWTITYTAKKTGEAGTLRGAVTLLR